MSVSFSFCTFTKNKAFLGGGLSIKIGRGGVQLTIPKTIITIKNSWFELNGCSNEEEEVKTRIGGGAHLSYNLIKSLNSTGNEYNLWNVSFIENCAEHGGGVYFFSHRHDSSNNSLLFDNCMFERNRAHTGSAIDVTPSSFVKLSTGHTTVPLFRNCSFLENAVFPNSCNTQRTAGIGTLYASLYDIKFEGENCFEYNMGTAVYMVNGVADLSDSTCLLYTSPSPRDATLSRMPSSA